MKIQDWLDFFRRYQGQKIFHFQHFSMLTGLKGPSLRVALKRLTDRKIIQRILRSYYANPFNPPTVEEVSAVIYPPSYISLESALCRHGVLSQLPYTLTCVTTRLPRKFKTPYGPLEYRQVKKKYFFGFARRDSWFLAEPEKAVADFLYLNRDLNKKDVLKGMFSEFKLRRLNSKKLQSYAQKMGISNTLRQWKLNRTTVESLN